MLKTWNPRERWILAAAFGVGLLFVVDRVAIQPLSSAWRQVSRDIEKKEEDMRQDRWALDNRRQIERDYRAQTQTRSTSKNKSQDATALLGEIESLARESGVKIVTIKPYRESVSVILDASKSSFLRFVYNLHQSAWLLRVEKANLQRKGEDGSLLQAQLIIENKSM